VSVIAGTSTAAKETTYAGASEVHLYENVSADASPGQLWVWSTSASASKVQPFTYYETTTYGTRAATRYESKNRSEQLLG
jgi:hypothetical protein